jgi:hypothetical protein
MKLLQELLHLREAKAKQPAEGKMFTITWNYGYGEHDGKSETHPASWFTDANGFTDDMVDELDKLYVGEEYDTGGPMDSVTITRESDAKRVAEGRPFGVDQASVDSADRQREMVRALRAAGATEVQNGALDPSFKLGGKQYTLSGRGAIRDLVFDVHEGTRRGPVVVRGAKTPAELQAAVEKLLGK